MTPLLESEPISFDKKAKSVLHGMPGAALLAPSPEECEVVGRIWNILVAAEATTANLYQQRITFIKT